MIISKWNLNFRLRKEKEHEERERLHREHLEAERYQMYLHIRNFVQN
jgi:hypothetical protein